MKWWKKILLVLLVAFIAIQFFQPMRNHSIVSAENRLENVLTVPGKVQQLFRAACYDCHSNQTRYPWYSRVQPFAWFLADHIHEGKEELNFHEFRYYSDRRKITKLNGIANSLKDGSMPLKSYKILHAAARLTAEEKKLIIDWATRVKDSLRSVK